MGIYDIPKEPGGLQFMGLKVVGHDGSHLAHTVLLSRPSAAFLSASRPSGIFCIVCPRNVCVSFWNSSSVFSWLCDCGAFEDYRQLFCRLSVDFYLLLLHDSSRVLLEYHQVSGFRLSHCWWWLLWCFVEVLSDRLHEAMLLFLLL